MFQKIDIAREEEGHSSEYFDEATGEMVTIPCKAHKTGILSFFFFESSECSKPLFSSVVILVRWMKSTYRLFLSVFRAHKQ